MNPVIDVSEHTDDGASEVSSLSESYRSRERTSDHQLGTTADSFSSNAQPCHQDENDIDLTATKRTAQQQQLQPTVPAARIRKLLDKHDKRDRNSNSAGGFIDSSLDVDDIFGISPGLSVASSLESGNNNHTHTHSFDDIVRAEEGLCQLRNTQEVERKPTVRFQENVEIVKPADELIEDVAQTPGNEPATDLLFRDIAPIEASISKSLQGLVDLQAFETEAATSSNHGGVTIESKGINHRRRALSSPSSSPSYRFALIPKITTHPFFVAAREG